MKIKNVKVVYFVFIGLIVFSFAIFAVAQEETLSEKNIFEDADQDGLSDEEELAYGTDPTNKDTDGDGYSDGIEVQSGYDPLKPAPGDKIVKDTEEETVVTSASNTSSEETVLGDETQENIAQETEAGENEDVNLTDNLSNKLFSLVDESVASGEDISIEDLDTIIDEAIEQDEVSLNNLPEMDGEEIKIKKQNYTSLSEEERKTREKEDALEYLTTSLYIMVNNLPYKISSQEDLEGFAQELISQVDIFSSDFTSGSYFDDLAERGETILNQMNEVEVPEKLVETHLKGIRLANYAISLKKNVKISDDDPVANILAVNRATDLMTTGEEFIMEIERELAKLGISEIPLDL